MKSWWYVSRGGVLHLSDQGVRGPQSGIGPGDPVLVGPSVTLRKHFRIPVDIERDEKSVMLEFFARYLPGSVEPYHCQFVSTDHAGDEKRDVLGLAVNREELSSRLGDDAGEQSLYLLERLLAEGSRDRPTLLTIPVPGGLYLGILGDTLRWGRFLPDPDDSDRREALRSVRERGPGLVDREDLPEYAGVEPGSSDWARAILGILPGKPDPALDLTRTGSRLRFQRFRRPAWTLVVVLLITLLSILAVGQYERARYRAWVRGTFQEQFGRPPAVPLEELRSELNRARQRVSAAEHSGGFRYPRVVLLDGARAKGDLRLLRLELTGRGASVILLSPSLEGAEKYLDRLTERTAVQTARISSTRSRERGAYRFQVTVQVRWSR